MTCIVEIFQGSDTFRFEAGDEEFVDATVTLNEGKTASTASIILADPLLDIFAGVPLPTKQQRITLDVWMHAELAKAVPTKVFAGFVQGMQINVGDGANTLQVQAADKLKGGRRRKKARIRRFSSAAQFVTKIAEENDLEVDLSRADLADVEFSRVVQHGETDWVTLNRVLESCGHKPKVRGNTLYVEEIGATRSSGGPPPVVATYGENLVSLDVSIAERTAARALNVNDFKGNTVETDEDAEAVDRPVALNRAGLALAASDFPSFTEAQILQAKKAQARAKRVFEGSVTIADLLVDVDTDDTVVLERVGARLSGVWNIDSVSLRYSTRQTTLGIYNGGAA